MEHYDSQLAQRVWDRVRQEPEDGTQGLGAILLREVQAAGILRSLQHRHPQLRPVLEQTRRRILCLRGIRYLAEGSRGAPVSVKPETENAGASLRRCFSQMLRSAAGYQSRSGDPEYGFCYAEMAKEAYRGCRQLLELLGSAPEGSG